MSITSIIILLLSAYLLPVLLHSFVSSLSGSIMKFYGKKYNTDFILWLSLNLTSYLTAGVVIIFFILTFSHHYAITSKDFYYHNLDLTGLTGLTGIIPGILYSLILSGIGGLLIATLSYPTVKKYDTEKRSQKAALLFQSNLIICVTAVFQAVILIYSLSPGMNFLYERGFSAIAAGVIMFGLLFSSLMLFIDKIINIGKIFFIKKEKYINILMRSITYLIIIFFIILYFRIFSVIFFGNSFNISGNLLIIILFLSVFIMLAGIMLEKVLMNYIVKILKLFSYFFPGLLNIIFILIKHKRVICVSDSCYQLSMPLKSEYKQGERICEHCNKVIKDYIDHVRIQFGKSIIKNDDKKIYILKNPDVSERMTPVEFSEIYIDTKSTKADLLEKFITFIMQYPPQGSLKNLKVFYNGSLDDFGLNMKNALANTFTNIREIG